MSQLNINGILSNFTRKYTHLAKTNKESQQSQQTQDCQRQSEQKFFILIDDFCSEDSVANLKNSNNIEQSNTVIQKSEVKVNLNQNIIQIEGKCATQTKKQKIIKAISKNQLNQTNSNLQSKTQVQNIQKPTPQKSENQKNVDIQLMPKVSSMNNLIKLSLKLSASTILSEIKTRGFKQKISPIRYLLYFCTQKILYTLWRDNGPDVMSAKLKNPVVERKFICEQILKGFIQLITYFNNLQRSLISKIMMTVFNRLGLHGIFNQTWIPSCVQANLNIFQKTKANIQELLSAPKTKNISSNIFINVPHSETLTNYDHLGLNLEDQDETHQRIDEVDKKDYSNKLFFFQNTSNKLANKDSSQQNKNINKILNNIPNQTPTKAPQKKVSHEKIIKDFKLKNIEDPKFQISLWKEKIPDSTKVSDQESDETKERKNNATSKSTPKSEDYEQLISQRRSRQDPNNLKTAQQCHSLEQNSDYVHASRKEIKEMIEEHLFHNFHQIIQKVMKSFKMKPEEVVQVLQQTTLNKMNPKKEKTEPIFQQIHKETAQRKSKKFDATLEPPQVTTKKVISSKKYNPPVEIQKKINTIPLTDKQIMALVHKASIDLGKQGYSQKEIVNVLFQILQKNNVEYEKKQKIIQDWFQGKYS